MVKARGGEQPGTPERLERAVADLTVQLAEAKAALEEARALASTDSSTGFLVEAALHDRLAHEVARAARFKRELALLVVHAEGGATADLCRSAARATDVLGILSDGAVAFILPETPVEGGLVLAERLRRRAGSLQLRLGCSGFPRDARGAPELLGAARRALRKP